MAHRVVWSQRAVNDLEAIATTSPLIPQLARFRRSGRKVPEVDDENVWELSVYSYRVIYLVEGGEVTIAAVVHGKRELRP